MMWFTADLHLGDTNILHDVDRPFDSVEEMNRKVIDAINECVAADGAPARAYRMQECDAHPR